MLTMTEPVLPEGMSGEQVRDALARVSAHKTFAGASRLRKLLEYVVEQSLAGHGDELKEYTIATSVLDKPEEFDPQTDSIVRVMFGRVRNGLQLYYATDGAADPVHIIIPLGGYQPQFVAVHDHDEISSTGTNTRPQWRQAKPPVAAGRVRPYRSRPAGKLGLA
jgi:hypothetical protein